MRDRITVTMRVIDGREVWTSAATFPGGAVSATAPSREESWLALARELTEYATDVTRKLASARGWAGRAVVHLGEAADLLEREP